MLQSKCRSTIHECHVSVGAVDGGVTQSYLEAEFLVRIRCRIAHYNLGDFKFSGFTGIGEGDLRSFILFYLTRIMFRGDDKSLCCCFFNLVFHSCRKSRRGFGFIVF